MPSTAETAEQYFQAVGRQDLATMAETWQAGKVSRLVGLAELQAPDEITEWFGNMFRAMPDFTLKVDRMVTEGDTAVVLWSATATFNGTGTFEGFKPNGAEITLEGMDMVEIEDGKIQSLVALINGLDLARQIGAVPAAGSTADKMMAGAFNAKTMAAEQFRKLVERTAGS